MTDLTPEAKAEIAAAVAIVRRDKDRQMLRKIHGHVTTPPTPPAPTPTPPAPTPTPTPPAPTPPAPPPPAPTPPTPDPAPKKKSAWWGDAIE